MRRGGKNGGDKEASGISQLLWAAKLQSATSADNPRYAADAGDNNIGFPSIWSKTIGLIQFTSVTDGWTELPYHYGYRICMQCVAR